MTIKQMQEEILRLKRERDFCILAHSYQATEIQEIADYTGDSFGLSVQASKKNNRNILMCGVKFMAETVKILSPEKTVILANENAGCPMAEQVDKELVLALKKQYPDHAIAAYINTTAETKTLCDVCVTSSSAVKILKIYPSSRFMFIPDCNLGNYISKQIPEKEFKLVQGGCPTHAIMTAVNVKKARERHPNALLLVHPECQPEVVELADYVGSTSGILEFARESDKKEFIIGTEISIAETLSYEMSDKRFYPLSINLVCRNMKATTLVDVYHAISGGGEIITLDENTISAAAKCINRMIELGA